MRLRVLSSRPRWWQWPTVLSLDAPAVALAWQALVARETGVRPGWPAFAVLGMSVWLAYAADRWLEGWRLRPADIRTQRHRFHQRARWPLAAVWVVTLAADIVVAARGLAPQQFAAGAILLAPVLAYVLSHQLIHRDHPWRLPKEICVAALIAAGALVFVVPQIPAGHAGRVIIPGLLMLAVFFANVALISVWEEPVDQAHGQVSLARQFAHGPRLSRASAWIAAGAGAAVALLFPSFRAAGLCTMTSGLLLIWIDARVPSIGWEAARVLADAVLLTPAVWLAALSWASRR